MPLGFLYSIQVWRSGARMWLRSLPCPVGTMILMGAVFLAVWPLVDDLRGLAETSRSQEAILACIQRYANGRDPQAFQQCLVAPAPVPIFLRYPPMTALVIALLSAPLALRWLRPRQVLTKPEDEDHVP